MLQRIFQCATGLVTKAKTDLSGCVQIYVRTYVCAYVCGNFEINKVPMSASDYLEHHHKSAWWFGLIFQIYIVSITQRKFVLLSVKLNLNMGGNDTHERVHTQTRAHVIWIEIQYIRMFDVQRDHYFLHFFDQLKYVNFGYTLFVHHFYTCITLKTLGLSFINICIWYMRLQ